MDGGLYLLGVRAPQPGLFGKVSGMAGAALAQTRARAQVLGLSIHLLKPLRDVDTLQDARVLGLLNS